MMITATPSFMCHYIRPRQERLRPRRAVTRRAGSVGTRVHLGRALISLGALLSGERVERPAPRSTPARSV